jgi:hypothetical protein
MKNNNDNRPIESAKKNCAPRWSIFANRSKITKIVKIATIATMMILDRYKPVQCEFDFADVSEVKSWLGWANYGILYELLGEFSISRPPGSDKIYCNVFLGDEEISNNNDSGTKSWIRQGLSGEYITLK